MRFMKRLLWVIALLGVHHMAFADVALTPENTKVTMAQDVHRTYGPVKVTDVFPREGLVYAYVTLIFEEADKSMWATPLTYKWYSGNKLIKTKDIKPTLKGTPFHLWTRMKAVDFAQGDARFEVYSKDELLATKAFTVTNDAVDYSLKIKVQK
jgi:hypothetical protein